MPNQGMTVEQFGQKIKAKYPQYANVPDADLGHKILEKYPQYQRALSTSTPTSTTPAQVAQQPQKPGLVQSLVQGVASPFLKLGTSVANAVETTGDLIQGNNQKAAQDINKSRDFGYFGKDVAPAVDTSFTPGESALQHTLKGFKGIASTGMQIGALVAPAEGLISGVGEGVLGKIGSQALLQGTGGVLSGAGSALEEKNASVGSVLQGGATGGLLGAATGGVLSGAGSLAGKVGEKIFGKATNAASDALAKDSRVASIAANNEKALRTLESGNATIRKTTSKAAEKGMDPIKYLSQTDLLHGAVDDTGKIRTTQEGGAVSRLQDFIKPQEDVISQNLAREGKTIPLADVRQQMIDNVNNSNIMGGDKVAALQKVENEIRGLSLEAAPEGDISLSKVHDAKRYKYANINYENPSAKNTDKIIARTLKDIVEKNTESIDVKALNKELAAHYSALSLLEKLDGETVQGGKLGKYFAKTLGAMAGSHFGPLGSIAGSEIAGKIQGTLLRSNFGKAIGKDLEQSQLMKDAIAQGLKPKEVPKPILGRLALPAPAIQPMVHDMSGATSQMIAENNARIAAQQVRNTLHSQIPNDAFPLLDKQIKKKLF